MAMNLYACTFKWLINKINQRIKGNDSFCSIGVLDIFGFENFDVSYLLLSWFCSMLSSFVRGNVTVSSEIDLSVNFITRLTGLNSLTSITPMRSSNSILINIYSHWSNTSTTGMYATRSLEKLTISVSLIRVLQTLFKKLNHVKRFALFTRDE